MMKHSSYLEKDEEQLLKERIQLGKSDALVVLTNNRIIFVKNSNEIINSLNYYQITKIQNSKPSDKKIDEQTVSKIRIIDQKGIKIDFSFKGLECINKSKKVTSLINKKRKETEKIALDQKENEGKQYQQSDQYTNDQIQKDSKKKYMTENTLKATYLEQNAAAKKMFKDLVVEEQILTEEEFWNNFKSEIAEQKALCQKNGYIFEEDQPKLEPTDNNNNDNSNQENINNENENVPIVTTKIEDNIQNLNAKKMEQEPIDNSEFKPSISISEVSEPVLPDEDAYIIYPTNESKIDTQEENENGNNRNEEEDEIEQYNFVWYQEVVEPLSIDPDEFREAAENFYSHFEAFSKTFDSLPEIVFPPMKEAKSIIQEISDENYRRFKYDNSTKNPEIITGLETLRKHKMEQQILLVHFWQNFENIKDQHNREKAQRLQGKINELKEILGNEKSAIKSKEARKALLPLYEEIEKSIFKVLEMKVISEY